MSERKPWKWNPREPWKKQKDTKLLRKVESGKKLTKKEKRQVMLIRTRFPKGDPRRKLSLRKQIMESQVSFNERATKSARFIAFLLYKSREENSLQSKKKRERAWKIFQEKFLPEAEQHRALLYIAKRSIVDNLIKHEDYEDAVEAVDCLEKMEPGFCRAIKEKLVKKIKSSTEETVKAG